MDNYSWTHGAHSAKFGYGFLHHGGLDEPAVQRVRIATATATLTNFAKDFTGNTTGAKNYSTFTQKFGNPIQDFRTTDMNLYAQDTWKLTKQLTLNYGLRYEYTLMPQPTIADPNYPASGKIQLAYQGLRAARQPRLLAERQDRAARRLRHLLRPLPRETACRSC